MKKLLFISLLFLVGSGSKAQCTANAGNDTAVCVTFGFDTLSLGGSPTATGGIPPYSYTWSCFYQIGPIIHTASYYLDDTTIANPQLFGFTGSALIFYLTVTDSAGNSCQDSISIRFSQWAWTLDDKFAYINQGDSVKLYKSIFEGIPPITYLWMPSTGLTNPTDVYTWAKPDTTTFYSLLATDSIGCQGGDGFKVYVYPTGLNDFHKEQIRITIHPNPTEGKFKVEGLELGVEEIEIYNLFGRLVLTSTEPEIDMSRFPAGLYIYRIGAARGKLVLE